MLIETDIEIKNKNSLKKKQKKTGNRKPYKKPITKQKLQAALNYAFSNLEPVDYNNDTNLMTLKP